MDWYTADQHFGHENIIKYCKRPFGNAAEMNEAMIARWNNLVSFTDRVFVVGDFSFMGQEATSLILSRLNGTKHLIRGNHDEHRTDTFWRKVGFAEVDIKYYLEVPGYGRVTLQHRPMPYDVRCAPQAGVCVHGHVHERYLAKYYKTTGLVNVNVGVNQWGFAPITLKAVLDTATLVQQTKEGIL